MSTCFLYTDLLEKGLELESCGMTDIAKEIYVSFVRGNAVCQIGKDTVDILEILYGLNVYNGVVSSAKALDYAYMALCGKRFLLDLYTSYGSKWQFVSGSASGIKNADDMTKFFHWLNTGTSRSFNLEKDSNRIMVARKSLKKEQGILINTRETIARDLDFLGAICEIAKIDRRIIVQ